MKNILEKLKAINYKSKKAIICYIVVGCILISGTGVTMALNINKSANSNNIVADNETEEFNAKDYYKYITGIKDLTIQLGTTVDYLENVTFDEEYIKDIKASDSSVDLNTAGTYDLIYKITTINDDEFAITVKVNVLDEQKIQEEIANGTEVITENGVENKQENISLDKVENITQTSSNSSTSTSNTNNSTSTTTSKPNNNTSSNTTTSTPTHSHSWTPIIEQVYHEEQGHYEQILIKEGWTEEIPIYENKWAHICNVCGADITGNITQHDKAHALAGEGSGWRTELIQIQVGTQKIEHPAQYEQKWVVDTPAWTEEKIIGYQCSCGQTK